MTGQWREGDFEPLRAAATSWVEAAIAGLVSVQLTRLRTVVSGHGLSGDQIVTTQLEVFDPFETAAYACRLTKAHATFADLHRAAAARRDVFDLVPELDETASEASLQAQRDWVVATVARPMLAAYLERAGASQLDPPLLATVLEEIEIELRSPTTPYTVFAPIGALRVMGGPIEILPHVFLRAATDADRERWLNRTALGSREQMTMFAVETILETRYDDSKGDETIGARRVQDLVGRLETAIQLALDCDARSAYLQFHREATFGTNWGGSVESGARHPRVFGVLRSDDVAAIRAIFASLTASPNLARCSIALRRWNNVCAGGLPDDNIVDAWVGLESLLFTGGSQGELTYRASLRLAVLIGHDGPERSALFREVGKAYGVRSRVLHGSDTTALDLPRFGREARAYLRRAIVAVLRMPSSFEPDTIEDRLLGRE